MSGTSDTTAVVRWASREAARRGLPLHLVHAWDTPVDLCVPLDPGCLPDVDVDTTAYAAHGPAAAVLLASEADLLVLGASTDAQHLSSLIRTCLRHATCPIAVVPSLPAAGTGQVVVGLHDCPTARRALRWAA